MKKVNTGNISFLYSNLKKIIQTKDMTCEVFSFFIENTDVTYVVSKIKAR